MPSCLRKSESSSCVYLGGKRMEWGDRGGKWFRQMEVEGVL